MKKFILMFKSDVTSGSWDRHNNVRAASGLSQGKEDT